MSAVNEPPNIHITNSGAGSAVSGTGNATVTNILPRLLPLALHQLPPNIPDFTGRADEIAHLTSLLHAAASGTATTIAIFAVAGMAGVGKSALAIHVANQLKHHFPDGQLYVNLRGAEDAPLDPTEALALLLGGLGVAGDILLRNLAGRAALYRSLLADKQVLVLLDNAHDAAQVRNLLPNSPQCVVLITSRAQLATLEGATLLRLDVLSEQDALALLGRLAGTTRLQAEPTAAAQILAHCGCLPLALRIVGARLKARPRRTLAAEATALADERHRLAHLHLDDLDVRAAFALSYRDLSEADRRLFRLLGLPESPNIAQEVAATLAGLDPNHAEAALEHLVYAQLVEEHALAGRYRLHDLLRLFAREQLDQEDSPDTQRAAWLRLAEWYRSAASARNALFDPEVRRGAALAQPADPARSSDGLEHALLLDALAWCDAEYRTILAAIEQCHQLKRWDLSRDLAGSLVHFFDLRALWSEWQRSQELALAASRALGDQYGEASSLTSLGIVYRERGRWADSITLFQEAQAIFHALGARGGMASTLNGLGDVYQQQGRWDEAIATYKQSLDISRELADSHGEGQTLTNLGSVYLRQGRWEEAIAAFTQSVAIARNLGDRHGESQTLTSLGIAYRLRGRWDDAIANFEESLAISQVLGNRRTEGLARTNLGIVYHQQGRWDEAIAAYKLSLDIFCLLGDLHSEAQALSALGNVYQQQNQLDQADAKYQKSLSIFRDLDDRHGEGETLANLGSLRDKQGHVEDAHRLWRKALTLLHPDSPSYQDVSAWLGDAQSP